MVEVKLTEKDVEELSKSGGSGKKITCLTLGSDVDSPAPSSAQVNPSFSVPGSNASLSSFNPCANSTALNKVPVKVSDVKNRCKKLIVENRSTRDSLILVMRVDSSKCRNTIIIAVTVSVGSVIIIAAVVAVVWVIAKKSADNKSRALMKNGM